MSLTKINLDDVVRASPCVLLHEVWKDDEYIVQVNTCPDSEEAILRLSVRRLDGEGGITWDELMRLKQEAGYDEYYGVELYPPESEVMNNMNARHIWLLCDIPDYVFAVNNAEKMTKQVGW